MAGLSDDAASFEAPAARARLGAQNAMTGLNADIKILRADVRKKGACVQRVPC